MFVIISRQVRDIAEEDSRHRMGEIVEFTTAGICSRAQPNLGKKAGTWETQSVFCQFKF